jgi:hypothetical protein
MGWDSTVGIVTGYGLNGKGVGVQILRGDHPTSHPMGTGALSMVGSEAHHSPPTCAEVKNTWIYISTSPYIFMA